MKKLYALVEEFEQFQKFIEEDEDEAIDEKTKEDTLEAINLSIEKKCENIVLMIKNISMPLTAIESEIVRLQAHKTSIVKQVNWFKNYVKTAMENMQIDKIETDLIKIRLQNSPISVDDDHIDKDKLPADYIKTEIIQTIDKKKILEDHRKGYTEIPGVVFLQNKHIRIY